MSAYSFRPMNINEELKKELKERTRADEGELETNWIHFIADRDRPPLL